ncbi:hypothetical protein [uncultured Corynebacterium sp.]|uniref:hypothetical protein n=1 Tax=uncultured Corynebacterium sp. TaxID=159447 RepID=UPI0025FD7D16|nr:hypothetical protein [uncultured Corynebacterium sp.]
MIHSEWFERVKEDSVRGTAKTIGIPQRTLAAQLDKEKLSPENVIAIAIAYGHHPVGALVETGYLDKKWATQVDPIHALRTVTEDQLADEVLRRMKLGQATGALDEPIDQLAAKREAKKSNTTTPSAGQRPYDDGMPSDAVADSSPEVGGTPDDYER